MDLIASETLRKQAAERTWSEIEHPEMVLNGIPGRSYRFFSKWEIRRQAEKRLKVIESLAP